MKSGLTTLWLHTGKKLKVVVTRDGSWTLICPKDQKRLLLLEKSYPHFLGKGKYRRSTLGNPTRKSSNQDLGIFGWDTDSEPESPDSDRKKEDRTGELGSAESKGESRWVEVELPMKNM